MPEYKVLEVSKEQDLAGFSRFLWDKGVTHRIVDQGESQWLLVGNASDAQRVTVAYQTLQNGRLEWSELPSVTQKKVPLWLLLYRLPVTLSLIILSVLGYLCVDLGGIEGVIQHLTFFQFQLNGQHISFSLPQHQYWRLITPIFLHFSLLHIVFNMLWLWDLGKRVELIQGRIRLLSLVLIVGLGSNVAQAVFADAGIFGGMSGVIYGLLSYGWVWSSLVPEKSLHIPKAIIIFMMVWLVVCMTGFTLLLGQGAVANAAHVGGLVIGLVFGFGAVLIEKRST